MRTLLAFALAALSAAALSGADNPNGYVLKYWVRDAKDNPHAGRAVYKTEAAAKAAAKDLMQYHRITKVEVQANERPQRPVNDPKEGPPAPSPAGSYLGVKGLTGNTSEVYYFNPNGRWFTQIDDRGRGDWKLVGDLLVLVPDGARMEDKIYQWNGKMWQNRATPGLFELSKVDFTGPARKRD